MKTPFCILLILFFSSCDNSQKTNESKLVPSGSSKQNVSKFLPSGSGRLIDYKASKYKLFIDQSLDSIQKILELRHDYLTDDGKINDTGITHYMNHGEDLLTVNNSNFLPALFLTMENRKLTEFKCSIIFTPTSLDPMDLNQFFKISALVGS